MNYFPLTTAQQAWKERTAEMSARDIGPRAAEYDRKAAFPQESLNALRDAGLWSIRVPQKYGGLGLDLVTTCLIVEEVAKKCPSTAMCYKMHLEAVEAISQIPTAYQRQRYIEPLLRGEVFAAAPGGEPHGQTGDDWTPVRQTFSTLPRVAGGLQIDHMRKSYVTSAGHATHYVMFCRVEGGRTEGPPELLIFKHDEVAWETIGAWNGLGMRGNSSVPMIFNGVVPEANLVGIELEDKSVPVMTKYMAPCQILTYGAAYLGIASGAFEIACAEGDKRFPSGGRRLDNPINQRRVAEMSAQIEAARALLHAAAAMADAGRATSVLPFLQAKVVCAEVGVRVTTDLMTMFGGTAFAGRLPFERYFRDARAGLVMGQANDVAYGTIGTLLFPEHSSDAGPSLGEDASQRVAVFSRRSQGMAPARQLGGGLSLLCPLPRRGDGSGLILWFPHLRPCGRLPWPLHAIRRGAPPVIIAIHTHVVSSDKVKHPLDPGARGWSTEVSNNIEDLIAEMDRAGVDGATLVQPNATYGLDNAYQCDSVTRYTPRTVAVGILDPAAPDAADQLA